MPVTPIDGKTVHSAAQTTDSGITQNNAARSKTLGRLRLRLRLSGLKVGGWRLEAEEVGGLRWEA